MSDEQHDHTWGLVMPFVVVESNGGPFNDHAFCAGVQFGVLMQRLSKTRPQEHEEQVCTEIVPQVDLLAMKEGYRLESSETRTDTGVVLDEWTLVKLTRLLPDTEKEGT